MILEEITISIYRPGKSKYTIIVLRFFQNGYVRTLILRNQKTSIYSQWVAGIIELQQSMLEMDEVTIIDKKPIFEFDAKY